MREVVVYSRRGCHLCEEMIEQVEPLCRGRASLEVRDIDTNDEWQEAYYLDIPVLHLDGREVCRHFFDRDAFLAALKDEGRSAAGAAGR